MRHPRKNKYVIITLLFLATLLLYFIFNNQSFLNSVSRMGYLGAFIGGVLYTSSLTASIGTVLLLVLPKTNSPIVTGILAAGGALITDLLIYFYIKKLGVSERIKHLIRLYGGFRILAFIRSSAFIWLLPVIVIFITFSPLPNEIGVGLLSISRIKTNQFIILTYLVNSIGIFAIIALSNIIQEPVLHY